MSLFRHFSAKIFSQNCQSSQKKLFILSLGKGGGENEGEGKGEGEDGFVNAVL